MNQFGGNWTEEKMDIVVKYASAYLVIMNNQHWFKTIYFDGFAGSGYIDTNDAEELKKGTALRILDIINPKPFDIYYFVELQDEYKASLESNLVHHPLRESIFVVKEDCNKKLLALAEYLKQNRSFRALVYIDPYGMTVNWSSIACLKDLGVDLWILVPTGIGVNRMLTTSGNISEPWLHKLESFLGISSDDIRKIFYKSHTRRTLFGEETLLIKERNAVEKVGELYTSRLKEIFSFVSKSFVMRNSQQSIMYHFMMATNNRTALKIANDVIDPKYNL